MRRLVGVLLALALGACTGGSDVADKPSPGATVRTASPSTTHGSTAHAVAARLRVLAPRDGDRVTIPFTVRYEISGLQVGADGSTHLHMYVEPGAPRSYFVDLPLRAASGSVTVGEGRNQLPGRRTVTFWVVTAGHRPVDAPTARVTVRDLVIEGEK